MSESLPAPSLSDAPTVTLTVFFKTGATATYHYMRVTTYSDAIVGRHLNGQREVTFYKDAIAGWVTDMKRVDAASGQRTQPH